ncbi:MAG TPA: DUF2802 domain-containing protein [Rhodanobacteraceae bacterium]|nr:DUF2802 domain-containing protein [Oleiagrimonas sp.]HET9819500.1 DUF2802 domain-containing protein [Rhodanobacteraceae bacterium]
MNIVIVGCVLSLLLAQLAVSLLAWRHLARRLLDVAEAQQRAAGTEASTSVLMNAVTRIEARLQQMGNAHAAPPAPQPQPQSGDRAYELAQRMARGGADATQIAEACGIAMHEAELLCRLHAPTR